MNPKRQWSLTARSCASIAMFTCAVALCLLVQTAAVAQPVTPETPGGAGFCDDPQYDTPVDFGEPFFILCCDVDNPNVPMCVPPGPRIEEGHWCAPLGATAENLHVVFANPSTCHAPNCVGEVVSTEFYGYTMEYKSTYSCVPNPDPATSGLNPLVWSHDCTHARQRTQTCEDVVDECVLTTTDEFTGEETSWVTEIDTKEIKTSWGEWVDQCDVVIEGG
jgi:hypothetical protein